MRRLGVWSDTYGLIDTDGNTYMYTDSVKFLPLLSYINQAIRVQQIGVQRQYIHVHRFCKVSTTFVVHVPSNPCSTNRSTPFVERPISYSFALLCRLASLVSHTDFL